MSLVKFLTLLLAVAHVCSARNVFIAMSKGTDSVLDSINSRSFSSRTEKLEALREGLIANAATSQAPLLKFLNAQSVFTGLKFESMWASNEIFVKGMPGGVLSSLQGLFGGSIASINDERTFQIIDHEIMEDVEGVEHMQGRQSDGLTWGLKKIQAPDAWAMDGGNNGNGIIVGGIDTGVRHTHEALQASYLGGPNAWFDPKGTTEPNDQNGHGTHTMGTTCGSKGIGVAPGAKWIACKGCQGNGCSEGDLKACMKWMICPTDSKGENADCSKTPVVINNSWGGSSQNEGFLKEVKAWLAAGITPIFANGNSYTCQSTGNPAHLNESIGIGSTTEGDEISSFSSKGPVIYFKWIIFPFKRLKPNLSAPGSEVRSAWFDGDSSYKSISGTSMAAPHVTGVVALMHAAAKGLTVSNIQEGLYRGATTAGLKRPFNMCSSDKEWPNNVFGYGLLNAVNSVKYVQGGN